MSLCFKIEQFHYLRGEPAQTSAKEDKLLKSDYDSNKMNEIVGEQFRWRPVGRATSYPFKI